MSHQGQGSLKHAATEPSHLESKRERRRGAGGRAAALRRAPSDSDCSGDTASLSADSAERAPRQPPQPTAKQRSRRRGSEWEVLEGLKDGQRFDRRPEVFNGYLHKKRKWPLKGWHKRFFVVDGGILVYARSPSDVNRGRLHGSVDVGLSVISAKARRRRIDIDADEFIYHLRAKTPDVFRTWLSVLKAHRLYRQHLLTFGAREAVPKIHPPLDDIPPTDSSSRSSIEVFSSTSEEFSSRHNYPSYTIKRQKEMPLIIKELQNPRSLCSMKCMARVYEGQQVSPDYSEVYGARARTRSPDLSGVTDMEKHLNSTDLDLLKTPNMESLMLYEWTPSLESPKANISNLTYNHSSSKSKMKSSKFLLERKNTEVKRSNMTAMYFFSRKKSSSSYNTVQSGMRKSKKCTNLVKYRNLVDEPRLQRPFSGSMLLGNTKMKMSKQTSVAPEAAKMNFQNQVDIVHKENKSLQDIRTESECDRITEKLMYTVLQNHKIKRQQSQDTKCYISKIVKELYDTKFSDADPHPAKALFKSLLEFWMKSTSLEEVRNTLKGVKSIDRPSNRYFTRNKKISCGTLLNKISRETQVNMQEKECHKVVSNDTQVYISEVESPKLVNNDTQVSMSKIESPKVVSNDTQVSMSEKDSPNVVSNDTQVYTQKIESPIVVSKKKTPPKSSAKNANESDVKERRVQELERLLKNTVYICEAACSLKEKDIHMTKKLIDNIGKHNTCTTEENIKNESSTELPKIQETINQLISDSSITSDMAKECLSAYLDVLMSDSTKNTNNSSLSSTDNSRDHTYDLPNCDVQTEAIQKKVSRSVTNIPSNEKVEVTDPGQQYLKDILDKITNILSKVNRPDFSTWTGFNRESKYVNEYRVQRTMDGDYEGFKQSPKKSVFTENHFDPKYDVEHVSMFSDPTLKGLLSFTVSVKDARMSPLSFDKSNIKFSRDNMKPDVKESYKVLPSHSTYKVLPSHSTSNPTSKRKSLLMNLKNPYMNCLPDAARDKLELRPFLSSSDATSKAYFHTEHESENSLNVSCHSHKFSEHKKVLEDDCYVLSSFQKGLSPVATKFQIKKKSHSKHDKEMESDERNIPERELSKDLPSPVKSTPKIIDEKFILLLMENLTLLSQNVPSLHKDINNLYLKIKKKHEKNLRSSSQRLGLLGKIYPEGGMKSTDVITPSVQCVNEPQVCEASVCLDRLPKACRNVAVNTSQCVCCFCTQTTHAGTQTANNVESIEKEIPITIPCSKFHNKNASVQTKKYTDNISVNVALSAQLCTVNNDKKDCCLETVITSLFDGGASQKNFRFVPKKDKKQGVEDSSKRAKMDWLKDYRLLPITIKVSTQSQTDRKLVKTLRGKRVEKDITAFPVLVKHTPWPARTNSVTNSRKESKKYNSPDRSDDMKTLYRCSSDPSLSSGLISPTTVRGPQAGFVSGTPGGRLASWIVESGGPLENVTRELGQAQLSVQQLQRLLDSLELQQAHHDTDVSLEGASPNVKKDRRKFGLRKKKSNSKCASVELAPPPHVDISGSHTALSTLTAPPSPGGGASSVPNSAASLPIACAATRPQSLPGAEALGPVAGPASLSSLTPDQQLREDFTVLAKDLVTTLKGVVSTLVCERSRLRAAMEAADNTSPPGGAVVAALRTNLSSALQQNSELRNRLSRIHDASDLAEISSVNNSDAVPRQFQASLSYSSSCVSASEFFDAEEHDDDFKPAEIMPGDEAGVIELDGDSSSEAGSLSSEEGSASSDNSDPAMLTAEPGHLPGTDGEPSDSWARRTRLPCARPTPGGPSLWNLLYKNIGKDLSQVSMPVTINEPLNMLQRLCEELEYSELLDSASECQNAIERMALIAAFAVSAYAATAHRAASKPFNPLLHETYECVRTDRGFRFIAEQVSHHPPISACHAESNRWCFWQEARIKTKFWGKSMEFQPTGRAHVRLLASGDHYSWNKVTTCVHNLFGGQRWVDQYGDMHITCHGTDITCKLNFIKASSWSSSRHEVRGAILEGGVCKLRLHGRWSEALYAGEPPAARCLWRPGAMPPDHELYYGFTRFAMELNELEPGMKDVLPHTDTRLRPDQRALEEGDVDAAERHKHSLEQAQRERRRDRPDPPPAWFRKAVEDGEETWVFGGEYWRARDAGFPALRSPRVW